MALHQFKTSTNSIWADTQGQPFLILGKMHVRVSTIMMIAFAVVFGLLAVFVAQTWSINQAELRVKNLEARKPAADHARTVVVASKPLRFGREVTAHALRESAVAGRGAAERRLRHGRRSADGRQARRADAPSRQTSRSSPRKSPARANARRCRRCCAKG